MDPIYEMNDTFMWQIVPTALDHQLIPEIFKNVHPNPFFVQTVKQWKIMFHGI